MSQKTDSDLVSIQFRVAGKRVLIRNAMIGAALAAALLILRFHNFPLQGLLEMSLGSLVIGTAVGLVAMLGQVAARPEQTESEFRQPINWKMGVYSGLITAWIALIMFAFIVALWRDEIPVVLIIGAAIGVGATIGVASVTRMMRSRTPQQLLGEGQFDPLRNIENREHARR